MLNGYDISNVNGSGIITRALGGDFVICKATEGLHFVDGCYAGFMARIRAAGKLTGSYHFAHWANNPRDEAAFYGAHNDRRDGEFEILDWEMYGGQANCPAGTHGPWVAEFLNARPRCGLYTNADMMGKIIASSGAAELKLIRGRVFWKATVGGSTPGNTYGFDRGVSIWQWRDTQGIDEDHAFISPQEWRALANGSTAPQEIDPMANLDDAAKADIRDVVASVLRADEFKLSQTSIVSGVHDDLVGVLRSEEFDLGNLATKVAQAATPLVLASLKDSPLLDEAALESALQTALLNVAGSGVKADVKLTPAAE